MMKKNVWHRPLFLAVLEGILSSGYYFHAEVAYLFGQPDPVVFSCIVEWSWERKLTILKFQTKCLPAAVLCSLG